MTTPLHAGRPRTLTAALLAAGLLAAGGTASAQNVVDARWQGWLGCWQTSAATDGEAPVTCVIPAAGQSAVELVTVMDGKVVSRDRIVASGERRETTRDGCTGWEEARWAADGRRVFLRSAFTCAGGVDRASSGVIAMSATGEWLDVQGVTAGGNTGVHVVRYDAIGRPATLPADVATAVERAEPSRATSLAARTAAAAPISTADVAEAVKAMDVAVVQAWITEERQGFDLDAKELVALADAGVPPRVIDVMVALSYPSVFAVAPTADEGGVRPAPRGVATDAYGRDLRRPSLGLDMYGDPRFDPRFGYSPYGYSRYGYGYGISRYGYGYGASPFFNGGYNGGYGWYPGSGPVVIIRDPNGDAGGRSPSNGRVVNGRGYTRGSDGNGSGTGRSGTPRAPSPPSNDAARERGTTETRQSAPRPAAGSSDGGTSTGRVAKPRNP